VRNGGDLIGNLDLFECGTQESWKKAAGASLGTRTGSFLFS
jgi:hypothetical protein